MLIKDNNNDLITIPLDLSGCMIHFKHRLPTVEEITSLKQYSLTQGEAPWNPSSFSDQVADKFYQQVIEAENHNVINKESHLKLSFFDPSDLNTNHLKAKPANLVFNAETIQEYMVNDIVPTSTDLHYSKALPIKLDYEKLSPYFAFRPHDVIQHTLRQTTQLAKSTIHYPLQRHLKSRFQMLKHKRLNEVIATATYFANDKSIEGYYCAQVFFGMTSKCYLLQE
jgi:hypothetical protein